MARSRKARMLAKARRASRVNANSRSIARPGDDEDYSLHSPYNPDVYKCSGYGDETWEYFDGMPEHGSRFTIDLKNGNMDRLRDIRPYLYYVGYCSAPVSRVQPEVEKLPLEEVENAYVRAGRKYLLKQQQLGVGYFLAERDWPEYNTERYTGWPFQAFVNGTPKKGDVGFDVRHDDERYEADCIGHVIATNVRTPLPKQHLITTNPDAENWDLFVQWMYSPEIHGAMLLVKGWYSRDVRYNRAVRGLGRVGWMSKDAVDELP